MGKTTQYLRSHWKLVVNIVTIVALIGLIYAVRHQLAETVDNFGKVNTWALLLIIPIEFWNYDAYARMYRSFFSILGNPTRYWDMFKVALELNMINHIFPSGGVSGFSYFSVRLRRYDITTAKATLVQTMKFIFLFISFEILLVLGLVALALNGKANNLTILIGGSITTLVIIATFGIAYVIGSKKRIDSFFLFFTQLLNRIIHRFRPKHPETINITRVREALLELHENYLTLRKDYKQLKKPFLFALIANLTEIMAIYVVYIAFGQWINPGAVILAYAVANFAGLISVLPGGVGIYEALMTAVLATAGVPASVSLPVTVMYRIINMTIQVVPGYYFYHKTLNETSNA